MIFVLNTRHGIVTIVPGLRVLRSSELCRAVHCLYSARVQRYTFPYCPHVYVIIRLGTTWIACLRTQNIGQFSAVCSRSCKYRKPPSRLATQPPVRHHRCGESEGDGGLHFCCCTSHGGLTIRLSKLGPARVGFQDQTRGYSRYDQLVGGAALHTQRKGERVAGSARMRQSKFSDWSGEYQD